MRKILMLAAGMALVTTSAMSQSSMRGDDVGQRRGDFRSDYDSRDRDRDYDRGRETSSRSDDQDRRGAGPSVFAVKAGDIQLRVRCGEGEAMRACVDSALTLLDRIRSQPPQSTSTTSPTNPPPR